MNIIVCIKQVPDTNEVKIDKEKGTLIRKGVPSIVNPEDKNGLEEALKLKEKYGGKVTAVTMGPAQAESALKEALAMGVDEAILLCDKAFAGSDTLVTAHVLAEAIKKIGKYDLIICGRQAIDGDTAQVGPQLAENLGIEQATYVSRLNIKGRKAEIRRELEDGYCLLETELPLLITVVDKINTPGYPHIAGIVKAYREKDIISWDADKLGLDKELLGLKGSPTRVADTYVPVHKKKGEIIKGDVEEQVDLLLEKLADEHLI